MAAGLVIPSHAENVATVTLNGSATP